jgi:hypothetical protein
MLSPHDLTPIFIAVPAFSEKHGHMCGQASQVVDIPGVTLEKKAAFLKKTA